MKQQKQSRLSNSVKNKKTFANETYCIFFQLKAKPGKKQQSIPLNILTKIEKYEVKNSEDYTGMNSKRDKAKAAKIQENLTQGLQAPLRTLLGQYLLDALLGQHIFLMYASTEKYGSEEILIFKIKIHLNL